MQAILFCGLQASGKTTFFKDQFFNTHIRISLDQLNTRNKEDQFIQLCLSLQQPFVIDNTNPTKADRIKYISKAKVHKFKVIGYYFQSRLADSLSRNRLRMGKANIPEAGIKATYSKLELPSFEEGFDELYYVEIENNVFTIKAWTNEI